MRRAGVSLALGVVALALAACSGTPSAAPTPTASASVAPTSPAPTASAPDTPAPVADPTCETILPPLTVEDYAEIGWTAKSEVFRVGSIELDGGIQCTWGNYSGAATDHVALYGWAPLDAFQRDDAIDELAASGWRREQDGDRVYMTESADTVLVPDENGYGLTYLFEDEQVTFADTKQNLLLVEWPPA